MRGDIILNWSEIAVGVVFTGKGQDFYFYYGLGLGRDRIFSVGVGVDGNGYPLLCHPLLNSRALSSTEVAALPVSSEAGRVPVRCRGLKLMTILIIWLMFNWALIGLVEGGMVVSTVISQQQGLGFESWLCMSGFSGTPLLSHDPKTCLSGELISPN